ncbi:MULTISPECIES: divergent PAP2 family protein [unclassified Fusibacter]|uniref:divergent PAP2 family protein n=1 Tax=unclassified Fusibacter TaxID=2624464 RepID=UPI001010A244|nr:divergent PAP2 family protein [Fusibacter sp. A1]MCK8058882.1 divergent PAP2 family protein [Fusibacter sp. A2]NPE21957.1 divergent PAP2 family protein [Fusibacter sp. A1]RXV61525.1 divergent PAP2 family protein [Fusibacter sp. A1]
MTYFNDLFSNDVFAVAFWGWLIAQVLKVILTLIIDRRFNLYRLIGSGGMPSSHSSMVMGLSTAVGLKMGFDSVLYGVSFVIALIVMYDASGVRRAVGKQAIILNTIIDDLYEHKPIEHDRLKELVGHTPFEVFGGAILGIVLANIMI